MPFTTLPGLLAFLQGAADDQHALNWREGGYWRHLSTQAFCAQVRRLSLGLHDLGLRPGHGLGILAPSSPQWLIADLAAQCLGAVSVPLFPNLSADHIAFECANAGVSHLVVIGGEAWRAAEPHLGAFSQVITKGVADRRCPDLLDVMRRGDRVAAADPARFARLRDAVTPDQLATIIHTSGSTGRPKGVELTQANLVSQVQASAERFPLEAGRDRALSCLPLAHVMERMVMYYYLASRAGVWFVDDIKQVGALLREVKPTVTVMVPRLVEKLHARIAQDVADGGAVKRRLGTWALDLADHHPPEAGRDLALGLADSLLYRKIRAALGGNLRYLIVGGAALSLGLNRFLINVGVPLYIGYGLTEASPVIAANHPGAVKPGGVGPPFPGVSVRIGAQGEILARGPGVMRGYRNDPEASARAIDADGWLHTGDSGHLDADGHLVITGRIKELLKTSNGKYVCPVPIEQGLIASGLIDQAMVVAEGRRFVSALLFPSPDALRRAKERLGCATGDDDALFARADFRREIAALVDGVNHGLDHWEQVRAWRLVATAPSIEREEMTPTLKLRRHVVAEHYAELIEAMYRDPVAAPAAPVVA